MAAAGVGRDEVLDFGGCTSQSGVQQLVLGVCCISPRAGAVSGSLIHPAGKSPFLGTGT